MSTMGLSDESGSIHGLSCEGAQKRFSAYLDGALTGSQMVSIQQHLGGCEDCSRQFAAWRAMQTAASKLGPVRAPADLALRLRVAISQERQRKSSRMWDLWAVQWENTVGPFLLRASAGLASAVLLIGTASLLVGTFAAPEPVAARDEPIGMASEPKLLYTGILEGGKAVDPAGDTGVDGSVIVSVKVDRQGRAYDFAILSGRDDARNRAAVENKLLFSMFEPARVFGEPTLGTVVLALSGVSVQG